MTETLFERYKEALRAGHVAVLRGRLEDAAVAYREAISITADRAVPRTALGGVQLRLGDPAGALETFDGALALDPDDDASLGGRAQALVVLRRTAEAAVVYDQLADVRAARGRVRDAAEAARRALAIEPTDERRRRHARLIEDDQAAGAPAVEATPGEQDGTPAEPDGELAGVVDEAGDAEAATPPEPPPDPEALIVAFEEAAARGDTESAAVAALAAARAHRADGRVAAAFDACLLGIGVRPGHVDLHLLLADLAVDHGWSGQAGDAYQQLLRLADLDGDAAVADLVRRTAADRLPDDPRFAPR
jgi:cytochrome c-type biogenesis protein CcmH/NrfG